MKRWLRVMLELLPSVLLALVAFVLLLAVVGYFSSERSRAAEDAARKTLDPAAWGANHVGQPVPLYTEGGECLFCHRHQVGTTWDTNKHNRTIRDAEPTEPAMAALVDGAKTNELAAEVQLLLGDTRTQRFLKRAAAYGHADIASVKAEFARNAGEAGRCERRDVGHREVRHAVRRLPYHGGRSGVAGFRYGVARLLRLSRRLARRPCDRHDADAARPERKDSPAAVSSICGSCHIRFGKSKSTGLPYPANFVAGDNLFKDFEVDWSVLDETNQAKKLNPADAHVMDNLREVVVYGNEQMTCLTCHDVHKSSSAMHRDLPVTQYCQHCHTADTPIKGHTKYEVHSERCEY